MERLPAPTRLSCRKWVGELAYGMQLYAARPRRAQDISTLTTLGDLERYCYFVAGTVGHLITDLFLRAVAEEERRRLEPALRRRAESFGIGLQLTNILKDVPEDHARGRCFIPEECLCAQRLAPHDLLEARLRPAAHASATPVFERALVHLDSALVYALALPPAYPKLRLFCLLPLWMAIRTLAVARDNDAMFTSGQEVKISRQDVADVVAECQALVARDEDLTQRYGELRRAAEDRK
jgi:farnesyl-diphosphate farnesyltransferase